MKMNRWPVAALLGLTVIGLLGGTASTAGAAEPASGIRLKLNETAAEVNGRSVTLETPPILAGDTTMVPLRFISEALGAIVAWDGAARSITLTHQERIIRLKVDKAEAEADGQPVALEQPAMIRDGTTLVPLRFVAEQLAQHVTYDGAAKSITLTPAAEQGTPPALPPEKKPTYPPPRDAQADEPARQKLESPTVDNLMVDPNAGKVKTVMTYVTTGMKVEVHSVVSDKKDHVYVLQSDKNSGGIIGYGEFSILKYDTNVPGLAMSLVRSLDQKFSFTYKDDKGTSRRFDYDKFVPARLHYSEGTGKLYVMGESIDSEYPRILMYEVYPEVKLAAVSPDKGTNYHTGRNLFAVLADGSMYYTDLYHQSFYSVGADGSSAFLGSTPTDTSSEMVSLVKDGEVYVLDKNTKAVYKAGPKGFELQGKVELEKMKAMTASGGFFYAADGMKVYQINLKGEALVYLALDKLTYNKGFYNPQTKLYEEQYRNEPGKLTIDEANLFTVDEAGSIYLFDNVAQIMRRINVYP
ncbi:MULTISPECIES: copper amine oxidase N-terminal domain-containing protein [Paenibacillus]|uniref:copper amine oxidase N-terminal domain-containing protein n=1 Tax=Paenibacillus TaxID=44249 RepID=UPI0022B8B9C4|nr:copper amine oxidase N-terminal domain-containing protein [Paenibacillus caseinilyticus]MCZ8522622.1 copper amine oxidase N-terminal domain-containing protein [Paenibacillus caseinilyticus]